MFTSIGKKVITTTTAAFDGQSKPNHITMMGAMPTIGRAAARLPSGRRPRRRNGTASARIATRKPAAQPRAQPISTACRKVWTKSAHRIGSEAAKRGADRRGARHQHGRHAEADGGDLPQEQDEGAEGQRHGEVEQPAAGQGPAARPGPAVDREPGGQPQAQHLQPEARAGGAGDARPMDGRPASPRSPAPPAPPSARAGAGRACRPPRPR